MIKTLSFGEHQVSFSTSFAWCFVYKSQFRRDPAQVLIPAIKEITENSGDDASESIGFKLYEILGFVEIADMAWAMARLVDPHIPEPIPWVQSLGDDFDLTLIVSDLIPEAVESCFATKKSQVPTKPATKAPLRKTKT